MISGAHVVVYSKNAEADRAFLSDIRPRLVNYFACMGLAARRSLLWRAVHQLLRLVPNRICHLPIVRGFLAATLFDASPVRPPLASGGYFLRSVGGWEFSACSAAAPI